MNRICVFCGSSPGLLPEYAETANLLGRELANRNIELVFGGSDVGLMRQVADAALEKGGKVIGVIPESFAKKVAHKKLSQLHVVNSMHERKKMMHALSDGFIVLPGAFGTLEEILEIVGWTQLGLNTKPFGFLNVCGYYNKFFEFADHAVNQQFLKQEHLDMIILETSVDKILDKFDEFIVPVVDKWRDKKKDIAVDDTI
jgi:uncharacterized protein (TIGR00730 family)